MRTKHLLSDMYTLQPNESTISKSVLTQKLSKDQNLAADLW